MVVAAAVFAGCTTSYEINVALSPKLKEVYGSYPALEVDIAGIDANEAERFAATPVDEYFAVGGALRSSTPHATLRFRYDDVKEHSLSSGDQIWKAFAKKDADRVVLLVNLPPLPETLAKKEKPGKEEGKRDFRSVIIPLENSWFSSDVRDFEITPVGINLRKE